MANLDTKALLTHMLEDEGVVVIQVEEFSSLPKTVSNDAINSSHVVINQVLGNPSAQTADWKVVTASGSLQIDANYDSPTTDQRTAAISGTTDMTLYLCEADGEGKSGILVVEKTGVSSLSTQITNSAITANHVCVKSELSNPSAQTSDWEVNTSAGVATITGSISGTTDIKLYLATGVA